MSEDRRVGIYIMPGNSDSGMLEDLCLATVEDHPAIPCLNQYINCLRGSLQTKPDDAEKDPTKFYFPKNENKAKAIAFLAALHETLPSVGIAAAKGYWNFDHPSLDEFKQFLQNI